MITRRMRLTEKIVYEFNNKLDLFFLLLDTEIQNIDLEETKTWLHPETWLNNISHLTPWVFDSLQLPDPQPASQHNPVSRFL